MRIEIEVPKELKQHFEQEFKDNLEKYGLKYIIVDEFQDLNDIQMDTIKEFINQLEDYGNEEIDYYRGTPYENCIRECVSKAIEIVKGGDVTSTSPDKKYFYVWEADAENDGIYRFFNSEDAARTAFLESKTENKTFGIASFAKEELTPMSVILSTL